MTLQHMTAASMAQRPLWPGRNWWLALLAILILAGALRYPGYDFSLPYVDHPDEPNHNLAAHMIVDLGTARPIGNDNYPPGIIMLNYVFLRFFHDPATPLSTVLAWVRLVAITTSLGVILLIALLGYHCLSPAAGLASATIWVIAPSLVHHSRLATPDIFVTFFTVLALWLALVGTLYRRSSWTTYAIYMLMLATVFKYQAIFIAPIIWFAPLWNGRSFRRRVVENFARFALFLAWLLFLTPLLIPQDPNLPFENWRQHSEIEGIPSPALLMQNLRVILSETESSEFLTGSTGLVFLLGWLGWVPLAWHRFPSDARRFALATVALSTTAFWVGISLFGLAPFRQVVPLATLLTVMAGIGYGGWWHMLNQLPKHHARLRTDWLAVAALSAFLIVNLPNLLASVADTHNATLPDQRNDLARYMDTTLAPGRVMANQDNHKTLNREWGGYPGITQFEYLRKDAGSPSLTSAPIDHWRDQGVLYTIMSYHEYQSLLREDPAGYLNETTLLKSFPPSEAHRGPAMVVLRLYPRQHPATGQLGPIQLIGYDLVGEDFRPGETISFHLYWQSRAPTDSSFIVFNHLLNAAGNTVAQIDGPPLPDPLLRRTTAHWGDPAEVIFSREFLLQLPENLAIGDYTLITGFYRRQDGARLLSPTGENSLYVTTIPVTAAE
ncbi:MAG: glycosyltransferase family 39 protein [Chloroflexi bacterium]|nr:glycosyltransferase family 39 protein [Chloroflexota bacterium]